MSSEPIDQIEELRTVHTFDLPPPTYLPARNSSPRRRLIRRLSVSCFSPRYSDDEIEPSSNPYADPPPSYSSIYANQPPVPESRGPLLLTSHSSFVAPIPPPSYAQSQGLSTSIFSREPSLSFTTSITGRWLPWPITAICPRCAVIVDTVIQVRRSIFTHMMAFLLFLFGCWPCCVLPYCMNPCKITDHYCPICRSYLGSYKPW